MALAALDASAGVVATADPDGTIATVTVRYEFGVTSIGYDAEAGKFRVSVCVQGTEESPVTFAKGVKLQLLSTTDEAQTIFSEITIEAEGKSEAVIPLDVPETRHFKVHAVR